MDTAIGNAIQALKDRVEDCYTAVDNKGGTVPVAQSDRNTTNLPAAIASIPSGGGGIPLGGIEFAQTPDSVLQLMADARSYGIDGIDDSNITTFYKRASAVFGKEGIYDGVAGVFRMAGITALDTGGIWVFNWCSNLREIYLDNLVTMNVTGRFLNASPAVRKIYVPKLESYRSSAFPCVSPNSGWVPDLIDITIGAGFTTSQSLVNWNPNNALRSDSSSLVETGEPFANNLEKFLYNMREHIAANLRNDVGNCTITFCAEVKAAILADAQTMNAFPANWTIA